MELSALLRQFAYDRLLCRVFSAEPERWVLKGATAMLARLEGQARHTLDVDLYRRDGSLADAEGALREAAAVDLGDYFRFTLGAPRQMVQGADAVRISVVALLGAVDFARFQRRRQGLRAAAGVSPASRRGYRAKHSLSGSGRSGHLRA